MLKALIKKEFKELLSIYKTGKNKKKVMSTIGVCFLLLFLYIVMAGAFLAIDFAFIVVIPSEEIWLYYGLNVVITIIFASFMDVLSTYVSLYKGKDKDLVLSLPIKSKTLLLSKVIVVFLFGIINESYVMVPAYILYIVYYGFSFSEFMLFLIGFILVGILITALTLVLSYLLSLVSNLFKSKLVKGILTMVILMGIYYVIYFRMGDMLDNFEYNMDNISNGLSNNFKLSTLLANGIVGDIKSLLFSSLIIILMFVVIFMLVNKNYIKIITKTSKEKKGKFKESSIKNRSIIVSLVYKELKHFTSSLPYLLNCGLGLMIMVFAGIMVLIKGDALYSYVAYLGSYLIFIVLGIITFITSMNAITAPSISLEGKNLWILKTSPIKYMDIFNSKILLHYILNVIPATFLVISIGIVLKTDVIVVLLAILTISIYILIAANLGLIENLKHCNLDWINETVPIKNSIAVLFTMLIMWGISLVVFGLSALLSIFVNTYIILVLNILIGSSILVLLYLNLKNKGVKRFINIS